MVPKWSLCDPPGKNYILPIHRNGRGQTGKFRSPNILWLALESFVLPLSTTYLKTKCADRFAEDRYFIEVRPLTEDKEWFQDQFTDGEAPLDPFDGPARPLDTPITTAEVTEAAKTLKNAKATGSSGIQNELLKYLVQW